MPSTTVHTPDELAVAVSSSRTWRGVLRAIGRNDTSAGALRAVQRQVEALGIDHSHFTGQRRWSDQRLTDVVACANSWAEVAELLGLADSGGNVATARAHALRLSLDVGHLQVDSLPASTDFDAVPSTRRLRTAAGSLAAARFQLRGYEVLWPQEGCRYDLGVIGEHGFARIQVKTTTYRQGECRLAMISAT